MEGERTASGLRTDGEHGLRTDDEREKGVRLFRKKLCIRIWEKMETRKRKRKEGRKKLGI